MKKRFTLYFSVTSKNKLQTFSSYSNKKSLKNMSELLTYSLNQFSKSPNQKKISEILKFAD